MAIVRYVCILLVLIAGMIFVYDGLSDTAKNDVKMQEFLSRTLRVIKYLIYATAIMYFIIGK